MERATVKEACALTNCNSEDNYLQQQLEDNYLQQLVAEACPYPADSVERQHKLNEIMRVLAKSDRLWKNCNSSEDKCLQQQLEDRYLQQLVAEARSYPADSSKRRRKLNRIMRVVAESNRLWNRNELYYEDALHATWINFFKNLEKYDPSRASLITWLNVHLGWRLQDFRRDEDNWNNLTRPIFRRDDRGRMIPVSIEDADTASPDIPPMLEETRDWAQTDSDGKLRNTIFRKRPEISAQVLILLNVIPPINWGTIAAKFQLTEAEAIDLPKICKNCWGTIAAKFQLTEAEAIDLPKFYSRRCAPLLKEFAKEQGYNVDDRDT